MTFLLQSLSGLSYLRHRRADRHGGRLPALIAANALTFLGAWLVSVRLPNYPPLPAPDDRPRLAALSDRAFVGYAAHNAALSMQYFVMLLPLPLWIVGHAPTGRPCG